MTRAYETSTLPVECGSCGGRIPAGMPIYRVTSARLPRCSSCVHRMGLEVLSASEANQVAHSGAPAAPPDAPRGNGGANYGTPPADPAGFYRFRRQAVAKQVRGNLIEWRQKQAGGE